MTFGTMERIQTVTVGSGGTSTIEFTNIPQTYDDLVVKMSTRNTATGVGAWQAFDIGFNGVLTNRSQTFLGGTGSSAISGSGTVIFGQSSSGDTTASTFANGEIYITNYRSSNVKSLSIDQVTENNATSALVYPIAGFWNNSAAITSIQLASNYAGTFAQHSTATLYGITRVPAGAKATGGVITDTDTHWIHTFTSSGTFTPSQNLTVEYLVIAGGGGGGCEYAAGGGGAGGYRTGTGLSVTSATNYTITVGAGGGGGDTNRADRKGVNGSDSVFSTITSTGGGGGGGNSIYGDAKNGGSGGGGGGGAGIAGTASPSGQGNNGGNASAGGIAGGGGGASQAGQTGAAGRKGGDGSASSITGTSVTRGGGGSGSDASAPTSTIVNGGAGGGGNSGNHNTKATDGGTNTGGGGGGGGGLATQADRFGGNGGSGIVIIAYAK